MNMQEIIRQRLGRQHLLAPAQPLDVAHDLCGIQAQFLNAALHALRIRTGGDSVTDGLIKTWTLRGTVHLIPQDDLPLYVRRRAAPDEVCDSGWYQWLQGRGHALPPERERFFACLIHEKIAQGTDTREALRLACRSAGMTDSEESVLFSGWGGIIAEMAQLGIISFRVQQEKAYTLCPPFTPMPGQDACIELARRYFTHYGPATLRDAAYFFRLPQKEIKEWLRFLPVETLTCENRTYYHIPHPIPDTDIPSCIFLAGFDQTMLGYRKEDNPLLPEKHLRGIYNLTGIVLPPVLLHGRVVGKWKHMKDHASITLFESISTRNQKLLLRTAQTLWPRPSKIE